MIDYTNAPQKVQLTYKGGAREKFDQIILTSRQVTPAHDDSDGAFYKHADPKNEAFRLYVLSDITQAPRSGTVFFIHCKAGALHKDLSHADPWYLWLEISNTTTFGYKATQIRKSPPN